MPLAALPPAVVKSPPAYRSLPDTASAYTTLSIPEPSADQLLPFHLAIRLAALPPAVVNPPPAYRSLPDTASAHTMAFIPEPSAVQLASLKVAAARLKEEPIPSATAQNSRA